MSTAEYSDADGQDSELLEEAGYAEIPPALFPARFAENHIGTVPRGRNREYRSTESFLTSQYERHRDISEGQGVAPSYLVVHRVHCDGSRVDGENHQEHQSNGDSDYLDIPRLFANDTRESALRGQQPPRDFEEYYEDNPGICMVVYRIYSCTAYHRKVKDSFEALAAGIDRRVLHRLPPFFFRLPDTGPPARIKSEYISFTSGISSAVVNEVAASDPFQLADWKADRHLRAPYDYFYHFRRSLRQQSASVLDIAERQELDVLLDYIDQTQGARFDQVDAIFASGNVHLNNFRKLFAPNDLIVTMQEGYPRAYIAERSSSSKKQILRLECWTWVFDGSFRRKDEVISVHWPAPDSAVVPIDSLIAWPLRLDKSDLRQRLEKRGREFWSCRHRRFVSYDAPNQTIFELQTVWDSYNLAPKLWIPYLLYASSGDQSTVA
jgi:hypothetical protein